MKKPPVRPLQLISRWKGKGTSFSEWKCSGVEWKKLSYLTCLSPPVSNSWSKPFHTLQELYHMTLIESLCIP